MIYDSILELVKEQIRRNNAVIEKAVEESLQRGVCGVFVHEREDGTVEATVHYAVPYGRVYYAPFPAEEFPK